MANLGQIAGQLPPLMMHKHMPFWDNRMYSANYTTRNYLSVPMNGEIYGHVKAGELFLPWKTVLLYYEPTGQLIDKTRTDAHGGFHFYDLNPNDSANYFAVALHDRGAAYNALIYRFLTPVVPI